VRDRVEIEAMLRAGESFGRIKERIEAMGVSEESKSALWLLAWSQQRADARCRRPEADRAAVLPPG
jgi:hypothetical protein